MDEMTPEQEDFWNLLRYNLDELYLKSSNNVEEVKNHEFSGCFCCISVFSLNEISFPLSGPNYIFCPRCGVDAVLPGITNRRILEMLYKKIF